MSVRQPRYTKDEHARLGRELYEQRVRAQVEAGNQGKIVAIDIETGEYEIAADEMKAGDRLRARLPEAQIWMVRIGHASARRFGFRQTGQDLP